MEAQAAGHNKCACTSKIPVVSLNSDRKPDPTSISVDPFFFKTTELLATGPMALPVEYWLTGYCCPNLPRYSEDVMKALTISALTKSPLN